MSDDLNIIVLAGGFGKRLKNTIGNIPKILAPINDKPFIYFLIEWIKPLMEDRDSNLIFSLHHEADQIIDYISNKSLFLIPHGLVFSIKNNHTSSLSHSLIGA